MITNHEYQNQEQDRRIKWLEDHYSTFNSEMGEVKTNIKWITKLLYLLISLMVGFDGSIITIIIYHIYITK